MGEEGRVLSRAVCGFLGGRGSVKRTVTPTSTGACYLMTFTFITVSSIFPSP